MATPVRHVIYLHGFASSPASGKAERFRTALQARGVGYTCPDLNEPAFETLTTSRMLAQVREIVAGIPAGPVALVGSSLGAFVAVLAANADTTGRIDRLVLMAPALDFGGNRLTHLGTHPVEEWKLAGSLTVFHYADECERRIGYALYEDAGQYDALTLPSTRPTLVFQGTEDDVVSPSMVKAWAADRPLVDLRLLPDGHQLSTSIHTILMESLEFLCAPL